MAVEEGTNLVWYLILILALTISMIGFYVYLRPSTQGGWFLSLANALKWLLNPVA